MKKNLLKVTALTGLALAVSTAQAGVVDINALTGAASASILASGPAVVAKNPNDNALIAWNEVQNYRLTSDLTLDFGGTLSAGTLISSHYVQWDPDHKNDDSRNMTGMVGFDGEVLGYLFKDDSLDQTDVLLGLEGNGGSTYNNFKARGLESNDYVTVNGNSISLDWTATSPGDWTRVVTVATAVPEPSTYALMLGGLGLVGFMAARRRKA